MEQIAIAFTGLLAIYLTQQSKDSLKKYACILGLLGQPFWFYAAYNNEQWGIFGLCIFYTYSWLLGVYNNWIKKPIKEDVAPMAMPDVENRLECARVKLDEVNTMVRELNKIPKVSVTFGKRDSFSDEMTLDSSYRM